VALKYDDFDLQIEPAGEKYRVRLLNAPSGQATTEFALPFTEIEVSNFLGRIGQVRRSMRRVDAPELQAAKEFGGKLFGAVFSGEMIAQLRSSMEQASDKEHGLRIRLRLTDVPGLADLPWEFLYDANQNRFLTTSSETPVVRFLDLPQRIAPLRVALPLRVLVMIASPRNLKRLDTEGEWERLQESLGDLLRGGQIVLERLPSATLDALRLRARGAPFHVFHFIGHGGFDEAAQDGVLQFEDETGMSYTVRGEMLGMQLHDHRSLRLAVLNACEGARSSRQDPFSGVAQSLLQQRVPAVIAMQFEISDAAAKVFAQEFYRAVAEGNPVDAAVSECRKALFKEEFGQEWATPVLYMRSQEGQLFELQAAVGAAAVPDVALKEREAANVKRQVAAKAEAERQAAEKAQAERAARDEEERQSREKAEGERLACAKADAERQTAAKAEAERQAAQKAEVARAAKAEKERLEREKTDRERIARAKADAEREAVAKAETERLAAQRAEAQRAADAEKERLAKEAAERARLARQKEEAERRAKEQAAYERLQREKAAADRLTDQQAIAEIHSSRRGEEEHPRPNFRVWLLLIAIPVLGLAVWFARGHGAGDPEAHYRKGETLRAQNNLKGALAEYREAIRLKPDYAAAHASAGFAFRDKGDLENAVVEFREVVRLSPKEPAAHDVLGLSLWKNGDLDGAAAEFREAIRLDPQDAETHYNLAKALEKKGDRDAAIAEYRETLRWKPDFAQTHSMPELPAVEKIEKASIPRAPDSATPAIKRPAEKPATTRISQGGSLQAAKLVKRVAPIYPPLALQTRVSGTVRLHVIIAKDGAVREVDVISGHPLLLQSAMNAVKHWRYAPTLLNGRAVEVDTTVEVEYTLANSTSTTVKDVPGPATPPAASSAPSPAPVSPPVNKASCTFGKIEYTEQGNMLIGSVLYTYQGSYPLDAVAVRGIALKKDKQPLPGLTYAQSTLKTASGTAPFSIEGHPSLNQKEAASEYLVIAIVVKQTGAFVCSETVPYQRKW
jgi:TonB family protein